MGVTIHYRLGQEKKFVPATLDRAQKYAEAIRDEQASKTGTPVEVIREHPYRLMVNIGGCETLAFGFGGWKHWQEKRGAGWSYETATLPEVFSEKDLADGEMMWCSAFCKTQYADALVEHKWVADILRMVAAYCPRVEVSDEGDYYLSGKIEDAAKAIGENGKMIASLTGMLKQEFGPDNVIVGGETKVAPTNEKPCTAPWCRKPAFGRGLFCEDHGKTNPSQNEAA